MFNEKELAMITSALIHESINKKYMISNGEYECEEELTSMMKSVDALEVLSNRTSDKI